MFLDHKKYAMKLGINVPTESTKTNLNNIITLLSPILLQLELANPPAREQAKI